MSSKASAVQAEPLVLLLSPPAAAWLQHAPTSLNAPWPLPPFAPLNTQAQSAPLSSTITTDADTVTAELGSAAFQPSILPRFFSPSSQPFALPPALHSQPNSPSQALASPHVAAAASSDPQPRVFTPDELIAQHRRSDAARRHREKAAVRRLEVLAAGPEHDDGTACSPGASQRQQKRHKLSVLEASAARIEQLERLLSEAGRANQRLSNEVSDVVNRERDSLRYADASLALHSVALVSERLVRALLDCRSDRLLDASSAFFHFTGFTPGGVLQRVLCCSDPSTRDGHRKRLPASEYPLVRARHSTSSGHNETVEWIPLQASPQYSRTRQLLHELLAGERETIHVPFRTRWASRQLTYAHTLLRDALCGCCDADFSSAVVLCHCRLCCVLW